jgi:hypothetical protein
MRGWLLESPRWLAEQGRGEEAAQVLAKLGQRDVSVAGLTHSLKGAWFQPLNLSIDILVSNFTVKLCAATTRRRSRRHRRPTDCNMMVFRVGLCVALHDAHWPALYV